LSLWARCGCSPLRTQDGVHRVENMSPRLDRFRFMLAGLTRPNTWKQCSVFTPGMTAPAHTHAGPEAWYTLAGETCLETPDGKQVGRAGGQYVIVPGGPPMHLTATGIEIRRALVLILDESAKPATTLVHDWTPKGLRNN
jgi:quercetin dioxygenase-like cupin family protein